MDNRTEMLTLHAVATTYNRRPSEIIGIGDEWAAYQFDVAVFLAAHEPAESATQSSGLAGLIGKAG